MNSEAWLLFTEFLLIRSAGHMIHDNTGQRQLTPDLMQNSGHSQDMEPCVGKSRGPGQASARGRHRQRLEAAGSGEAGTGEHLIWAAASTCQI